jgi:hypothetical protein
MVSSCALTAILAIAVLLSLSAPAAAQQRHALIVSGVSGGEKYAESHNRSRRALAELLRKRFAFAPDRVVELAENESQGIAAATRENVRQAVGRLQRVMNPEDLLLLVLIGHGTFDGIDAKFNLPGPDLEAAEWAELLADLPGTLILVNTASASFPFLEHLAGPRRIVITATDSPAQRYTTVFPEFFVQALDDPAADFDKNGRISIWEAFLFASTRVRQHYEQRGQLATERALLDDDGDGLGKEAGAPGPDGVLAARTFLDAGPGSPIAADAGMAELMRRRMLLEVEVEELKGRKNLMQPADYAAELERVLIELARVSREIRNRS